MAAYGGAELAAAFRTVRGNTLKAAEEIPEDKYGFAPAEGSRTVAQTLAHIVNVSRFNHIVHSTGVKTIAGYNFAGMHQENAAIEAKLQTKAQIIAALTSEGEKFASWLESLSDAFLAERVENFDKVGSKSRLEMLLSPKEHEMHHRAQLMVTQRMIGVTPHLTRARMAQMAAAAAAAPKA